MLLMILTDNCFIVNRKKILLHPSLASLRLLLSLDISSCIIRKFSPRYPINADLFHLNVSCTAHPMFSEDARAALNEP